MRKGLCAYMVLQAPNDRANVISPLEALHFITRNEARGECFVFTRVLLAC